MPRKPSLKQLYNILSPDEARWRKTLRQTYLQKGQQAFAIDDAPLRLLYLTPDTLQSAMHLDNPAYLLCAYSRVMMEVRHYMTQPQRVLIIGLGGGSLLKHCFQEFPDALIDVVEIDPQVLALRQEFLIPPDGGRLRTFPCDVLEFIPQCQLRYDLILLNAFDGKGMVATLNTDSFYQHCQRCLSDQGVMALNIWGRQSILSERLLALSNLFANRISLKRSPDSYNLLVFASMQPLPEVSGHQHLPAQSDSQQTLQQIQHMLASLLQSDAKVPADYQSWREQVLHDYALAQSADSGSGS